MTMKKTTLSILAAIALSLTANATEVSTPAPQKQEHASNIVTTANFVRAESDMQMQGYLDNFDAFGKFHHSRAMYDVTEQITIRANTDTMYSFGIFDLSEPLKLHMPKTDRYQSAMIVSQDHSLFALYGGDYTLTQKDIGTKYVFIIVRTFADPSDKSDLEKAHAVQDAITVSQKSVGSFKIPAWDKKSLEKKRKELIEIANMLPDSKGMFGKKDTLNPVTHLLGAAYGWGGLPEKDASYVFTSIENNDGKTVNILNVKDVPVDGFWSVTVYNKEGYFDINERNLYSLNSKTTKRNDDGSVTIQFGDCKGVDNCLDIMDGWNYTVRLYQPQKSILDGSWTFPEPTAKK